MAGVKDVEALTVFCRGREHGLIGRQPGLRSQARPTDPLLAPSRELSLAQGSTDTAVGSVPPLGCDEGALQIHPRTRTHP
jgi:hypothetical protein